MELRDFQQEASDKTCRSLREGNHPCVQLPTGTGKSLVIADLARRFRERDGVTWVLTHVKELISQNREKLELLAGLDRVGTVCAGLGEKTEGEAITFATIQSMAARVKRKKILRPPDAIIIDECHRIPMGTDGKLYKTVLQAYPEARRIGFTATPWRMDGGGIYGDHEGTWFNDLAYSKSVPEMVKLGWLCPLVGIETEIQLDLAGVGKTGGDYKQGEVGDRMVDEWLAAVVKSVIHLASNREHVAVYCPTVKAANKTAEAFSAAGWSASVVVGETENRSDVIDEWKAKGTRVLCSVDVLTTGFDHPALDCIVCLRPTESSSLWVQILGRGTRIFDGKEDCLVLDYVGNLGRLGGIGMMEDFIVERKGKAIGVKPATGKAPRKEKKKPNKLEAVDPMSGKAGDIKVFVTGVTYVVIGSRTQPGKAMVMVSYDCHTEEGYTLGVNDFLCVEYSGFARQKAEAWAAKRNCFYLPHKASEAQQLCYSLATPRGLKVRRNGKYWNVQEEFM